MELNDESLVDMNHLKEALEISIWGQNGDPITTWGNVKHLVYEAHEEVEDMSPTSANPHLDK